MRKRIIDFNPFVKIDAAGEDLDESIELSDKDDDETVNAYTMYMTEVMSAFVFQSNPAVNLEVILPTIKDSATKIIKITKYLMEVIDFVDTK